MVDLKGGWGQKSKSIPVKPKSTRKFTEKGYFLDIKHPFSYIALYNESTHTGATIL